MPNLPKPWTLLLTAVLCLFYINALVAEPSADNGDSQIAIAIPDLTNKGGVDPDEASQISDLIRARVSEGGIFRVVEREQLGALQQEKDTQLANSTGTDDTKDVAITGAGQLLLGSIGKLYGRMIISLKLTDATTGEILFATTKDLLPEQVIDKSIELTESLKKLALDRRHVISADEVITEFDKNANFTRAKELLDALQKQHGEPATAVLADARIQKIQKNLPEKLFNAYLTQAQELANHKNFPAARELIAKAIALQPEEKAFRIRDQIVASETVWAQEQVESQRILLEKEQIAKRKRLEDLTVNPFESIETYYRTLRPGGIGIAADTSQFLQGNYNVPIIPDDWGGAFQAMFQLYQVQDSGPIELDSLGYFDLAIDYHRADPLASGGFAANGSGLVLSASLSPHLAATFKFFNLMITTGVDGGCALFLQNELSQGYQLVPTAGLLGRIDLKIWKTMGLFAYVKPDYFFRSAQIDGSNVRVRIGAGVAF